MSERNETKVRIMEAAIEEFNLKGLKFTMDDVAKRLGMSKKTLYTVFEDKEALFLETVDYCFDAIKESERKIVQDPSMDVVEKIRRIMIVLPDRYQNVDLRQFNSLKEKFPATYEKVAMRLESDWDSTIALLEQGKREGKLRDISIPILKTMVEGTIEQFFSKDVLVDNDISYEQGLEDMIDIIMAGIVK